MIKFLSKLIIAVFLVFWLVKSGRMDFSLLIRSFENKMTWTICLLILTGNVFLITLRWKKLLDMKSDQQMPFFTVLRLTWIGNLFNTILPGAVSGDIIKLIYAKNIDQKLTKTFLLASVVMDRFIGLFGLLFLLGIFSLIHYDSITKNYNSPALTHLIHINFIIAACMATILLIIFLGASQRAKILAIMEGIPFVGKILHQSLGQVWALGEDKKMLLSLIGISMVSQALNIFVFWFLATPFLEFNANVSHGLPLSLAFTFIPLGFVTMSIPITPAGIGVGHVAFSTLFAYFGISNGASLFNLHFLAAVVINLLGVFPYLYEGKKYSAEDFTDFEKVS